LDTVDLKDLLWNSYDYVYTDTNMHGILSVICINSITFYHRIGSADSFLLLLVFVMLVFVGIT
jgi:hypothetical protein